MLKQTMKHVVALLAVTLLSALTSCEDVLEKAPPGTVTIDQLYSNNDDLELAIAGVYGIQSNNWIYRRARLLAMLELRTDAMMVGKTRRSGDRLDIATYNYNAGNGHVSNIWEQFYKGINNANLMLELGPQAERATAEVKSRTLAEAHYFRAFYYFQMVRLYGRIPLILESPGTYGEALTTSQAEIDDIYEQIIIDAKTAAGEMGADIALPETGDIDGRLTIGAAHTLLADIYLTLEDYAQSSEYAKRVIDSGQFDLWENYADAFSIDLQYSSNDAPLAENVHAVRFAPDIDPGSRFTNEAWPRGLVQPYSAFPSRVGAGEYEVDQVIFDRMGTDDRRDSVIMPPFFTLGSGREQVVDSRADTIPSGSYTGLPFNKVNDENIYFVTKFESDNPRDRFGWSLSPFPVYRYADVLLMYLEAKNEMSEVTQSDLDMTINRTRTRGGKEPLTVTGSDELLEIIKEERFIEFFYEGKRFYDLVRWGDLIDVVNSREFSPGNEYGMDVTIDENFIFLPVPQRELDINVNLVQIDGF